MGPDHYFPGQHSNTIPSGTLKFYVGFQKVTYEPLENWDFFGPQYFYWRSPYQTQKIYTILKYKFVKFNSQRNRNVFVPTFYALSKQNLYQIINQSFGNVSISRLKLMERTGLVDGIPTNIPDW